MSKIIEKIMNYVVNPVCPGCNKSKLTDKIETECSAFWMFIHAYQFKSKSNIHPLRLCKGCYETFLKDAIMYQGIMAQREYEENKETIEIQSIIGLKNKTNLPDIESHDFEPVVN